MTIREQLIKELLALGYSQQEADTMADFLIKDIAAKGEGVADVEDPAKLTEASPTKDVGPFQLNVPFWREGYKDLQVPEDYYANVDVPDAAVPIENIARDYRDWYIKTVAAMAEENRRLARLDKSQVLSDQEGRRRYAAGYNRGGGYINHPYEQQPEITRAYMDRVQPRQVAKRTGVKSVGLEHIDELTEGQAPQQDKRGMTPSPTVSDVGLSHLDKLLGLEEKPAEVPPKKPVARADKPKDVGLGAIDKLMGIEPTEPAEGEAVEGEPPTPMERPVIDPLTPTAPAERAGSPSEVFADLMIRNAGKALERAKVTSQQLETVGNFIGNVLSHHGSKYKPSLTQQNGNIILSIGDDSVAIPTGTVAGYAQYLMSQNMAQVIPEMLSEPLKRVKTHIDPKFTKADISLLSELIASTYNKTGLGDPRIEITPSRRGATVKVKEKSGREQDILLDAGTLQRATLMSRAYMIAGTQGTIPEFEGNDVVMKLPRGSIVERIPIELLATLRPKSTNVEEAGIELVQELRKWQTERLPEKMWQTKARVNVNLTGKPEIVETETFLHLDEKRDPFDRATLNVQAPGVVRRFAEAFAAADGDTTKQDAIKIQFERAIKRLNEMGREVQQWDSSSRLPTQWAGQSAHTVAGVLNVGEMGKNWISYQLGLRDRPDVDERVGDRTILSRFYDENGEGMLPRGPSGRGAVLDMALSFLNPIEFALFGGALKTVRVGGRAGSFVLRKTGVTNRVLQAMPSQLVGRMESAAQNRMVTYFAQQRKALLSRLGSKVNVSSEAFKDALSKTWAGRAGGALAEGASKATLFSRELEQELVELGLKKKAGALTTEEAARLAEMTYVNERLAAEAAGMAERGIAAAADVARPTAAQLTASVADESASLARNVLGSVRTGLTQGTMTTAENQALRENLRRIAGQAMAHDDELAKITFDALGGTLKEKTRRELLSLANYLDDIDPIIRGMGGVVDFAGAPLRQRAMDNMITRTAMGVFGTEPLKSTALRGLMPGGVARDAVNVTLRNGSQVVIPKALATQMASRSIAAEMTVDVGITLGIIPEMVDLGEEMNLDDALGIAGWMIGPVLGFEGVAHYGPMARAAWRRNMVTNRTAIVDEEAMARRLALNFTQMGVPSDAAMLQAYGVMAGVNDQLYQHYARDGIRQIDARLQTEKDPRLRGMFEVLKERYAEIDAIVTDRTPGSAASTPGPGVGPTPALIPEMRVDVGRESGVPPRQDVTPEPEIVTGIGEDVTPEGGIVTPFDEPSTPAPTTATEPLPGMGELIQPTPAAAGQPAPTPQPAPQPQAPTYATTSESFEFLKNRVLMRHDSHAELTRDDPSNRILLGILRGQGDTIAVGGATFDLNREYYQYLQHLVVKDTKGLDHIGTELRPLQQLHEAFGHTGQFNNLRNAAREGVAYEDLVNTPAIDELKAAVRTRRQAATGAYELQKSKRFEVMSEETQKTEFASPTGVRINHPQNSEFHSVERAVERTMASEPRGFRTFEYWLLKQANKLDADTMKRALAQAWEGADGSWGEPTMSIGVDIPAGVNPETIQEGVRAFSHLLARETQTLRDGDFDTSFKLSLPNVLPDGGVKLSARTFRDSFSFSELDNSVIRHKGRTIAEGLGQIRDLMALNKTQELNDLANSWLTPESHGEAERIKYGYELEMDGRLNHFLGRDLGYITNFAQAMNMGDVNNITRGNDMVSRAVLQINEKIDDGKLDEDVVQLLQPAYNPNYFNNPRLFKTAEQRQLGEDRVRDVLTKLGLPTDVILGAGLKAHVEKLFTKAGFSPETIASFDALVPISSKTETGRTLTGFPVANQAAYWINGARSKLGLLLNDKPRLEQIKRTLNVASTDLTRPLFEVMPGPFRGRAELAQEILDDIKKLEVGELEEAHAADMFQRQKSQEEMRRRRAARQAGAVESDVEITPDTTIPKTIRKLYKLMVGPRLEHLEGFDETIREKIQRATRDVQFGIGFLPLAESDEEDDNGKALGLSLLTLLGGFALTRGRGGIQRSRVPMSRPDPETPTILQQRFKEMGANFFSQPKVPAAPGGLRLPRAEAVSLRPNLFIQKLATEIHQRVAADPVGFAAIGDSIVIDGQQLSPLQIRQLVTTSGVRLGAVPHVEASRPVLLTADALKPGGLVVGLSAVVGREIDQVLNAQAPRAVELMGSYDVLTNQPGRRGIFVPIIEAERVVIRDILKAVHGSTPGIEAANRVRNIYAAPQQEAALRLNQIAQDLRDADAALLKLPEPPPAKKKKVVLTPEAEAYRELRGQHAELRAIQRDYESQLNQLEPLGEAIRRRWRDERRRGWEAKRRGFKTGQEVPQSPTQITGEAKRRLASLDARRVQIDAEFAEDMARLANVNRQLAGVSPEAIETLRIAEAGPSPAETEQASIRKQRQTLNTRIKSLEDERKKEKMRKDLYTTIGAQVDPLVSALAAGQEVDRQQFVDAFIQALGIGRVSLADRVGGRGFRLVRNANPEAWSTFKMSDYSSVADLAEVIETAPAGTPFAFIRDLSEQPGAREGLRAAIGGDPTPATIANYLLDPEGIYGQAEIDHMRRAALVLDIYKNIQPDQTIVVSKDAQNAAAQLVPRIVSLESTRDTLRAVAERKPGDTMRVSAVMAEDLRYLVDDIEAEEIAGQARLRFMAVGRLNELGEAATRGMFTDIEDIVYDQVIHLIESQQARTATKQVYDLEAGQVMEKEVQDQSQRPIPNMEEALPHAVMTAYSDKFQQQGQGKLYEQVGVPLISPTRKQKAMGLSETIPTWSPVRRMWAQVMRVIEPQFQLAPGDGPLSIITRDPVMRESLDPSGLYGESYIAYTAQTGIDPIVAPQIKIFDRKGYYESIPRLVAINQAVSGHPASARWDELGQFYQLLEANPAKAFGLARSLLPDGTDKTDLSTITNIFYSHQPKEIRTQALQKVRRGAEEAGLIIKGTTVYFGDLPLPENVGELRDLLALSRHRAMTLEDAVNPPKARPEPELSPEERLARPAVSDEQKAAGSVLYALLHDSNPNALDIHPMDLAQLSIPEFYPKSTKSTTRNLIDELYGPEGIDAPDRPLLDLVLGETLDEADYQRIGRVWEAFGTIGGTHPADASYFARYLAGIPILRPLSERITTDLPSVKRMTPERYRNTDPRHVGIHHRAWATADRTINGGDSWVTDMVSTFLDMEDVYGGLDPALITKIQSGLEEPRTTKQVAMNALQQTEMDLLGYRSWVNNIDVFDDRAVQLGRGELSAAAVQDLVDAADTLHQMPGGEGLYRDIGRQFRAGIEKDDLALVEGAVKMARIVSDWQPAIEKMSNKEGAWRRGEPWMREWFTPEAVVTRIKMALDGGDNATLAQIAANSGVDIDASKARYNLGVARGGVLERAMTLRFGEAPSPEVAHLYVDPFDYARHYLVDVRGIPARTVDLNEDFLRRLVSEEGLYERIAAGDLPDPIKDELIVKAMGKIGPDVAETLVENFRLQRFDPAYELSLLRRTAIEDIDVDVFNKVTELINPMYERQFQKNLQNKPGRFMDLSGIVGEQLHSNMQIRGLSDRSVDASVARRYHEWLRVNKDTVYKDIRDHLGDEDLQGAFDTMSATDPELRNRLVTLVGLKKFFEDPDPLTHYIGERIVQTVGDEGLFGSLTAPARWKPSSFGFAPALPFIMPPMDDEEGADNTKWYAAAAIATIGALGIAARRRSRRIHSPAEAILAERQAMSLSERTWRTMTMTDLYPNQVVNAAVQHMDNTILTGLSDIWRAIPTSRAIYRQVERESAAVNTLPEAQRQALKGEIDRVRNDLRSGTKPTDLSDGDKRLALMGEMQRLDAGSLQKQLFELYVNMKPNEREAVASAPAGELYKEIIYRLYPHVAPPPPPGSTPTTLQNMANRVIESLTTEHQYVTPGMVFSAHGDMPIWKDVATSMVDLATFLHDAEGAVRSHQTNIRSGISDITKVDTNFRKVVERALGDRDLAGVMGTWFENGINRFTANPDYLAMPRIRITPNKIVLAFDANPKAPGWKGVLPGWTDQSDIFLRERGAEVVGMEQAATPGSFPGFNPSTDQVVLGIKQKGKSLWLKFGDDTKVNLNRLGDDVEISATDMPTHVLTSGGTTNINGHTFTFTFFDELLAQSDKMQDTSKAINYFTLPILTNLKLAPAQLANAMELTLTQFISGDNGLLSIVDHAAYNEVGENLNKAVKKTVGGRGLLGFETIRSDLEVPEGVRKANQIMMATMVMTKMHAFGSNIGNSLQFLRMMDPATYLLSPHGIGLGDLTKALLVVDSLMYPEVAKVGGWGVAGLTAATSPMAMIEAGGKAVQQVLGNRVGPFGDIIRHTGDRVEMKYGDKWLPLADALNEISPGWKQDALGHQMREVYTKRFRDQFTGGVGLAREERAHPWLTLAGEVTNEVSGRVALRTFKHYTELHNRMVTPAVSFVLAKHAGLGDTDAVNIARSMQLQTNTSHATTLRSPMLAIRGFGGEPVQGWQQELARSALLLTSTAAQMNMSGLRAWGKIYKNLKHDIPKDQRLTYAARAIPMALVPFMLFGAGGAPLLLGGEVAYQGYRWLFDGKEDDGSDMPHTLVEQVGEWTGSRYGARAGQIASTGLLGMGISSLIGAMGNLITGEEQGMPSTGSRVATNDNLLYRLFGMAHDAGQPGLTGVGIALFQPAQLGLGFISLLEGWQSATGHSIVPGMSTKAVATWLPSYFRRRFYDEVMDIMGEDDPNIINVVYGAFFSDDPEVRRKARLALWSSFTGLSTEEALKASKATHRMREARSGAGIEIAQKKDILKDLASYKNRAGAMDERFYHVNAETFNSEIAPGSIVEALRDNLAAGSKGYEGLEAYLTLMRRLPRGAIGDLMISELAETLQVEPEDILDQGRFLQLDGNTRDAITFELVRGVMALPDKDISTAWGRLDPERREIVERTMLLTRAQVGRNRMYRALQMGEMDLPEPESEALKKVIMEGMYDTLLIDRWVQSLPGVIVETSIPTIELNDVITYARYAPRGNETQLREMKKVLKLFEATERTRLLAAVTAYPQAYDLLSAGDFGLLMQSMGSPEEKEVAGKKLTRRYNEVMSKVYMGELFDGWRAEHQKMARDIDWEVVNRAIIESGSRRHFAPSPMRQHLQELVTPEVQQLEEPLYEEEQYEPVGGYR
jgi:hypothetical protein